jgi:hypothetical protein
MSGSSLVSPGGRRATTPRHATTSSILRAAATFAMLRTFLTRLAMMPSLRFDEASRDGRETFTGTVSREPGPPDNDSAAPHQLDGPSA